MGAQGRGKWLSGAGAGLLALASASAAMAQTATGQALPNRDDLNRLTAAPPARAPRVRVEGELERSPCPLADPAYANIRLDMTRVQLDGLRAVSPEDLEPAYRDYLGPQRPISDICEIRDSIATELRRRGYLAAVQVPSQQIDGGVVHLQVLFARLTAIRVRGDAGRSERLVAAYLQPLTEQETFNQYDAERRLLLARDLPGIDVRLALKPAGGPGEVYGEVTLERTPIQADFNVQNLAAENTGRFGGQARMQLNGLTGLGDQTSLALYSTLDGREQQVAQAGHEFRIGDEGLRLGGRFTYAWTRPDLDPSPDLIRGRTALANIEARYPLERTQSRSLWVSGGLDYVNQRVRFDDTPIAVDHLSVLYLRLDGEAMDTPGDRPPLWRASWSVEARQGLELFNATTGDEAVAPSRADADGQTSVLRASTTAEWRVTQNVVVAGAAVGQYAFDPLLSYEEFSAGNYTIGRGYDPGTLLGDDAVGLSLEARIERWTPWRERPIALQPFVFVEAARVWNKRLDHDELSSYGAGVRATFANRFRLDLTYAVSTQAAGLQTDRDQPRLLVSFTTRLWPWRSE